MCPLEDSLDKYPKNERSLSKKDLYQLLGLRFSKITP